MIVLTPKPVRVLLICILVRRPELILNSLLILIHQHYLMNGYVSSTPTLLIFVRHPRNSKRSLRWTHSFNSESISTGGFCFVSIRSHKTKLTKFTSPFLGPYEVLSQTKNDVQCRHLCMGNVAVFHVTRLKLFAGSRDEAYKLPLMDADQHQFNRILA
jgi:hypothetical protein